MFKDIYLFLREIKGVQSPPLEAFLKKLSLCPAATGEVGHLHGKFPCCRHCVGVSENGDLNGFNKEKVIWVCLKMGYACKW